MAQYALDIPTPAWCLPLLPKRRYKGAKGGRGSGKSHFFAEAVVEAMTIDKDLSVVCVREIQKSLKFSAKKLIEQKIRDLKVEHLFKITDDQISRIGGSGVCIFQGLQDHTAESIKSLDGFKISWVEEANSITRTSLEKLLPTIRAAGSEVWFSWNPDQPDDPVEKMFADAIAANDPDYVCVHVNFLDNPFCPQETKDDARRWQKYNPDTYGHVWLGDFNTKSDAKIFNGKWLVDEFIPGDEWDGPYHGLDFGFSQDPTAATKSWINDENLYIEYEAGKIGLELDQTAEYVIDRVPEIDRHVIRADSARPESISYLKRHGLPRIIGVDKGKGSVEDGIEHIKSYKKVIIHPRCKNTIDEFRLYSYRVDKNTGDIMPDIIDAHNHYIDSVRYALRPLMSKGKLKISKTALERSRA